MSRKALADLIGGPHALSVWSWLAPLPLLIALRLLTPGLWQDGGVGAVYLLATAAGQAAVGLGMLVPRMTYLRPYGRDARPVAALLTFAALGALRVLAIAGTESLFGVALSRPVWPEVVIGAVQGMTVLALVAAWVDSHRHARASHDRLLGLRASIRRAAERDQVRIDELLRGLLSEVSTQVGALVHPRAVEESQASAARTIRGVAEDYIRPLSHRLALEPEHAAAPSSADLAIQRLDSAGFRARARAFLWNLQPGSPLLQTATMLVLTSGTKARLFGPGATVAALLTAAPVLYLGSALIARIMRRVPSRPAFQLTTLVLGNAAVAVTALLVNALTFLSVTGEARWFWTTLFTYTFIAILASFAATGMHMERRSSHCSRRAWPTRRSRWRPRRPSSPGSDRRCRASFIRPCKASSSPRPSRYSAAEANVRTSTALWRSRSTVWKPTSTAWQRCRESPRGSR